ncbi:WD repeat-containing protein 13-like isoform X2 [Sycon ciliatum]|uniref:WD repeat-containing protein 13-like isoform X2 n=1 Tax=Sycon ciliatum TaxID=27933 RepID=UPI0020A98096
MSVDVSDAVAYGEANESCRHSMDSLTGSASFVKGHHRTTSSASGGYLAPPAEAGQEGLVPTANAQASRKMAGDTSLIENYEFQGMYHIFDHHRGAVTALKFGHDDRTRLAISSTDGTLTICRLEPIPASVEHTLLGHTKGVTDFDWSQSNDFIISSSLDCTVRLWNTESGSCLRSISLGAEVYCCRFQPSNNNMFVCGTAKCQLHVFNVSTGKSYKGSGGKTNGPVSCVSFDRNGEVVWAGDAKGFLYCFCFHIATGRMQKTKRTLVSLGNQITSISSRSWMSREARDPSLLVNSMQNGLLLFRINPDDSLVLKRQFSIKHSKETIRSIFCPLMSFRQGACVVSGSEDLSVYFYNVDEVQKPMVNKLQGHSAAVIAVSFNYNESLLASGDSSGTVIVWNRQE